MKNKKGLALGDMPTIGITFVVIAVVLSVGASILAGVQSNQTADTYAYNASSQGLQGTDTLAGWLPTIAIVVAAGIVIGVIVMSLRFRN
jgi:hypothetical protein